MSCPYFKEGTFGICVAPDAIHVPSIKEMEKFCFRKWYGECPSIRDRAYTGNPGRLAYFRPSASAQEFRRS